MFVHREEEKSRNKVGTFVNNMLATGLLKVNIGHGGGGVASLRGNVNN